MAASVGSKLSKVVTSALVLIPPENLWPPIQTIRAKYDKAYKRWMPHINLLYPFVPAGQFKDVLPVITAAIRTIAPFEVTLRSFQYFVHSKRSCTLWLAPEAEPADSLRTLQATLEQAFPHCKDLSVRSDSGYVPHLSVGQFTEKAVAEYQRTFSAEWQPLQWHVDRVHLISRIDGETPFRIRYTVHFNGTIEEGDLAELEEAETPSKTKLFVGNLPFRMKDHELEALFRERGFHVKQASIVRRGGHSAGFGFVELAAEEEMERALRELEGTLTADRRTLLVKQANKR